jgi:hypothetical protein
MDSWPSTGRGFLSSGTARLPEGVRFLDFGVPPIVLHTTVPERLHNVPPGHYNVSADEVYLADPEGATIYKEKGKEPIVSKEKIASLEAQARRLLEHAQEMRDKVERFGEDDYPDGAIISFGKIFPGGTITYQYAAIKINNLWSTTGPRAPKSYTWDELINWMGEGVQEIWYVTKMERVV